VVSDTLFSGNGDYALYATGANTVTVTGSTFQNNTGNGLYTTDGTIIAVSNSTFSSNGNYPLRTAVFNLPWVLSGNTFTGNSPNCVLLGAGPLSTDLTFPGATGLAGLEMEGSLTVPAGTTLTVQPGTTVVGRYGVELNVQGRLSAVGTATQPITFTSWADSGPGEWSGLVFDGGAGDLRHAVVRYATTGVRVQEDSIVTIEYSSILGNANFGIENVSANPIVQAADNWWGHPSGPYHPVTNPDGLGNAVSDNVAYDPWLASPPGSRYPVSLTLGQPVTATVNSLGYADYQLVVTAGLSLIVEVTPLDNSETLWVYGRVGALPLWTRYDFRTQEKTSRGTYELLVSPTLGGTYYFSVYGRDVSGGGGNYRIVVNTVERQLSDIVPRSAGNAGEVTLNLSGVPFVEGMGVQLRHTSLPTLTAYTVTVASPTTLWARFDLTETVTSVYDVVTVWPGGVEASLTDAFTVTQGTGPHLETRLVAPEAVRPGRQYVLWLEYANTGDADMVAPLLTINSPDGVPMRLSDEDSFEDSPVQVLGIDFDGYAGRLPPGATGWIPIYFSVPPAMPKSNCCFAVGTLPEDSPVASQPINWDEVENEVRPPGINPEVWDILWPALTAQIGDTWGGYIQVLADSASYAKLLGQAVYSVEDLFRFEVYKALGTNPRTVLASQVDAYVSAPGMPLQFGRVFPGSLEGRFYLVSVAKLWIL
jgi:hypothetical protein